MSAQIIPLDTSPNQTFQVSLNVDGNVLNLTLEISFNSMAGWWVMSILDSFGNVMLDSIDMITGAWPAANLLQQYGYMKIGSAFIINVAQDPGDYPNATNLGSSYVLLWDDTAA